VGPRRLDERGVVLPSPVVMLSVVAVAMASVAFVATRGGEPTEREVVTPAAQTQPSATPSPTDQPVKPTPPPIKRGKIYVEVYNNSGITGLAGRVATSATEAGWKVVGTDNWYGSVPTSTVYYPKRLKDEAELLALDLGIERTARAVDPMRLDRLTIVLTGELR